jgi:hypothetical protein
MLLYGDSYVVYVYVVSIFLHFAFTLKINNKVKKERRLSSLLQYLYRNIIN